MRYLSLTIIFLFLMSMGISSQNLSNPTPDNFVQESQVISDNECYLFLCTDENGEVVAAACLEGDEDGLICTGCTPGCPSDGGVPTVSS